MYPRAKSTRVPTEARDAINALLQDKEVDITNLSKFTKISLANIARQTGIFEYKHQQIIRLALPFEILAETEDFIKIIAVKED